MKDRIEIYKEYDENGNEVIKFYLHCAIWVCCGCSTSHFLSEYTSTFMPM